MTLIKKFSIMCFIALVMIGISFGWIMTSSLEYSMLTQSKKITAVVVSEEFRHEFRAEDFISVKEGQEYEQFTHKISHLTLGMGVERIKLWNTSGVVIWADNKALVGQRFPDNADLSKAIRGEIVSEISRLQKNENALEKQHERLLELYVPISYKHDNVPDAVVEVYQNLDELYRDINANKRTIWSATGLGFTFLYAVLFSFVWKASRRIDRQNDEIIRSESRYRHLVRSANDGIISVDRSGVIILFNDAAEKIFGCTSRDVIGLTPLRLMPEHRRSAHAEGIKNYSHDVITSIIGKTVEMEGLHSDGHVFPLELSISASGEGEGLVFTGIVRDISERKAMQKQLINAEKQASVSVIAGSIGHEINNATGSLLGYAELLKMRPKDSAMIEKCSEVFISQSQTLKLHAVNLLSLSKPRQPELKPLDINELFNRATDLLLMSGILKFFTVSRIFQERLDPVMADEGLIEQVIRNLEINAAHAMGNFGVLTLRTRFSERPDYVELLVEDTGHGIPEDRRDNIFLPFYTTKEEGKGTGLGLYIVKQITEQHHGYVHVHSEEGKGTCMTIGLPAVRQG